MEEVRALLVAAETMVVLVVLGQMDLWQAAIFHPVVQELTAHLALLVVAVAVVVAVLVAKEMVMTTRVAQVVAEAEAVKEVKAVLVALVVVVLLRFS